MPPNRRRDFYININVTIQQVLSREAFCHKIWQNPETYGKNPIAEGDFQWIFARNCEGAEQLHINFKRRIFMRIKIRSALICFALILGLAGCGKETADDEADASPARASSKNGSIVDKALSENGENGGTVGISMPSQSSEKWIHAAAIMNTCLKEAGFQVQTEFAEDDAKQQIRQLEELAESKVKCLIVAPLPSADLTEALEKAKKNQIPVISYDRLVMDTDAVDYYAGFDNLEAGRQIGKYILEEKGLKEAKETKSGNDASSYTIEFFTGDPQDYSAKMVHQGILEVLQPYLDAGRLVCKSGRVKFEDAAILYESQDTAEMNCEALLDANYLDGHLDIACTSADALAYGVRTALENKGYTKGKDWPLITGQDAELAAVENIEEGYQAMSVFRDPQTLARQCAQMAVDCMKGEKAETNEQKQYKNGTKAVPAYLCETTAVDKKNYREVLLDSGYYTEAQLP